MPVLALVLVVVAAACGTCMIVGVVRGLRTPPELRGDWWSDFERQFRAYAAPGGVPNHNREHRRHRGERA